jgi:hypothetical protein
MNRIEKALMNEDNRLNNGVIETRYDNGNWVECCPKFICCGDDDCDSDTKIGDYGSVKGCRGVTCEECWVKEA